VIPCGSEMENAKSAVIEDPALDLRSQHHSGAPGLHLVNQGLPLKGAEFADLHSPPLC